MYYSYYWDNSSKNRSGKLAEALQKTLQTQTWVREQLTQLLVPRDLCMSTLSYNSDSQRFWTSCPGTMAIFGHEV